MNVRSVYIEITNQCNLNCRTCYNRSGANRERRELSAERVEQILQRFLPYGLQRVLLSGGEPSLHTEFDQILSLTDRYPDLTFGIVTNGTVHDPQLISAINTKENFFAQISLDGSSEPVNAKTRGVGNFEKTLTFLRQLRSPAVPPRMKCVLSQQNLGDLEAYYALARALNCIPEFAFIYRSGNGGTDWERKGLSPRQRHEAVGRIRKLNREYGSDAFLPGCTGTCPFSAGVRDLSLCIRSDGAVQPCQMLYGDPFTLTNALRFDEAEFSSGLERICRIASARRTEDYGCSVCPLRQTCGKGCMAMAEYVNSDPMKSDGDCDFRRMQFFADHLKEVLKSRETKKETTGYFPE